MCGSEVYSSDAVLVSFGGRWEYCGSSSDVVAAFRSTCVAKGYVKDIVDIFEQPLPVSMAS